MPPAAPWRARAGPPPPAPPRGPPRLRRRQLLAIAVDLRTQLGQLPLDPLAVLAQVRHLLLEPRGLRVSLVKGALRGMHRIAAAEVLRPRLLEALLGRAQP